MRWRVRVRPGGEVGTWVVGLPRAAGSPTWASPGVLGRCSRGAVGSRGRWEALGWQGAVSAGSRHLLGPHCCLQVQASAPLCLQGAQPPASVRWCFPEQGGASSVCSCLPGTVRVGSEGWTLQEAGVWVLWANRTFWLRAGLSLCALPVRLQSALAGMIPTCSAASEAPQRSGSP